MRIRFNGWSAGVAMAVAVVGIVVVWTQSNPASSGKDSGSTPAKAALPSNSSLSASGQNGPSSFQNAQAAAPSQWVFPAPEKAGTKVVDVVPGAQPADDKQPQAEVQVGGAIYRVTPNDSGYFGQIDVAADQKLKVKVYMPDGQPGDNYIVQLEDGGKLLGQKLPAATSVVVDDAKQIAFNYQVSNQPGIYRVVLRSGGNVKVLNFWVGPELPVSVAR